jgi:hypothetical protein
MYPVSHCIPHTHPPQVHKARLRTFQPAELAAARLRLSAAKLASSAGNGASSRSAVTLKDGQGAWDICNLYAVSLAELSKLNPGGCDLRSVIYMTCLEMSGLSAMT